MTQQFEQKTIRSSCPYCGVGCGVDITTTNGIPSAVVGSPSHPANLGRLCVKGSNLIETIDHDGRLLHPMVDGKQVDWPQATQHVAEKFSQIIDEFGPDSVAFYVSGQILTEDYYIANKLMKGFIGSANIDTNSRLCMSSAVAGYKRAFGSDTVPCSYEDLDHAELLVLVGSNAAWTHPVLFQRMEKAKQANPNVKIIVIDPRRSATAELADAHLPLKAGSDVALFNGLLHYLIQNDAIDNQYINAHCEGWATTAKAVASSDLTTTALLCDLTEQELEQFYQLFAQSKSSVTFYSQGVNQSSQGVDKCNAIINCHLATGKIGKLGSGPFSITGQPNAMGGREVGGLANMLAAHMNIEDKTHRDLVQEFWQSPTICQKSGAKAVDLFDKINSGEIKAVWIMATNPLVSMPNRNVVEQALKKCEFVVVSDCMEKNDTLTYADVKLPATTWGEKDGTVTNSERRISRQTGLMAAPGEAKHDWQIIRDVAHKMGFTEHFNYQHSADIFKEHARLSGYKNGTDGYAVRDFDISALSQLSLNEYNRLTPIQWPVNSTYPNGRQHIFDDGKFYTPSQKAQFINVVAQLPQQIPNVEYPFILNSGRLRDQWHTMSRTGKSAALAKNVKEPFLFIRPEEAEKLGLTKSDLVKVASPYGEVILPLQFDKGLQTGNLFAPIHWSQLTAPTANIAKCFGSFVDPISGQPECKFTVVKVEKYETKQFIQCFSTSEFEPQSDYWAKVKIASGFEYICATSNSIDLAINWCREHNQVSGDWSYFENSQSGIRTVLCIKENKLQFAAFLADYKPEINADWVESLFAQPNVSVEQINRILRADVEQNFLNGKTICSCFKVGETQIINAIVDNNDNTTELLGKRLKCGTNCGSCKSELRSLINEYGQNNSRTTNSLSTDNSNSAAQQNAKLVQIPITEI
jgi:assimilatory nitrate reductase catalytic subunit